MSLIHRLHRWYVLKRGLGRAMLERGATIKVCPHCEQETPVYRSEYNDQGDPVTFTVCLWCGGFMELSGLSSRPHPPYAKAKDVQASLRRSRP